MYCSVISTHPQCTLALLLYGSRLQRVHSTSQSAPHLDGTRQSDQHTNPTTSSGRALLFVGYRYAILSSVVRPASGLRMNQGILPLETHLARGIACRPCNWSPPPGRVPCRRRTPRWWLDIKRSAAHRHRMIKPRRTATHMPTSPTTREAELILAMNIPMPTEKTPTQTPMLNIHNDWYNCWTHVSAFMIVFVL